VPQNSNDSRWTVMVFMGADTVEGEASLVEEARKDIEEMRTAVAVRNRRGAANALNLFVQLHRPDYVQREHVGRGKAHRVPVDSRDATNGKALVDFMNWALKTAKHRTKDHSMLILWGHAYQFAIARAKVGAGQDALDFGELADVLRKFQREYKEQRRGEYASREQPMLDILAFDACELATVEMAVQFHEFAKYLIASQIAIPLPGWPYDRILERLRNPFGRPMGPAEFGTYIVRRYCETYQAQDRTVSLTLLDLDRAPELFGWVAVLALRLAQALSQDRRQQLVIHDLFARSRTEDARPFVDVADLCLNLRRYCRDEFVRDAARALGNLLITPRPDTDTPESGAGGGRRAFIAEHGRNSGRTARLHGVSLYAPHVAPSSRSAQGTQEYKKLLFTRNTVWGQLVHALAMRS
jgi:hypothetical protein